MATDATTIAPYPLEELTRQAPFVVPGRVKTEWLDYNGHMNVAYYSIAFDETAEVFRRHLGVGGDYVKHKQGMIFVTESHLTFQRELREGEEFEIRSQILSFDEKRMHVFSAMYSRDRQHLAATNELMILHIDYQSRRVAPWSPIILDRITRMFADHEKLPKPEQAGRSISLSRPKAKL